MQKDRSTASLTEAVDRSKQVVADAHEIVAKSRELPAFDARRTVPGAPPGRCFDPELDRVVDSVLSASLKPRSR